MTEAERSQALSPSSARWHLEEFAQRLGARAVLCDIHGQCSPRLVDLSRVATSDLLEEVARELESGRLMMVPARPCAHRGVSSLPAPTPPAPMPPEPWEEPASRPKRVVEVYWSYGPGHVRLAGPSRHYVDLNLHVVTENYAPGETVEVVVRCDHDHVVWNGRESLRLSGAVAHDQTAVFERVFEGGTLSLQDLGD